MPSITLDSLVDDVNRKLNARGGMRIVGNPQMQVRRIGLLPGSVPIQTTINVLPQVDALIAGEIREWESSEYARDTVSEGLPRALILLGRTLSEDPGMKACAQWLETIVPDVSLPLGARRRSLLEARDDGRRRRRTDQEERRRAVARNDVSRHVQGRRAGDTR